MLTQVTLYGDVTRKPAEKIQIDTVDIDKVGEVTQHYGASGGIECRKVTLKSGAAFLVVEEEGLHDRLTQPPQAGAGPS